MNEFCRENDVQGNPLRRNIRRQTSKEARLIGTSRGIARLQTLATWVCLTSRMPLQQQFCMYVFVDIVTSTYCCSIGRMMSPRIQNVLVRRHDSVHHVHQTQLQCIDALVHDVPRRRRSTAAAAASPGRPRSTTARKALCALLSRDRSFLGRAPTSTAIPSVKQYATRAVSSSIVVYNLNSPEANIGVEL